MTEKLKQIIQDEIAKLPRETQEAINSLDWGSITEEIGKKYLFDESEINNLQVETLLVLVGLEDGNYYAQNIENEVGTSKEEAEKIAGEAFQKIFTPIGDLLEEKVKKNLKAKNPSPEQNLDFILSGGDYSAFVKPTRENSPLEEHSDHKSEGGGQIFPPRLSATPQEGNK
ncbi:MAG: hypothetical protein NTZ87_03705 [Candidatus Nomurabacteria bacterium]|nr:hypothetical protein [Candidatus Nomurabacteria bacterium]